MNKKLKNKIAALFAVLSVCSPQNSRAANSTNNKIMKYLAICIPALLGGAGLIWGGVELVKYLKNKSNDQENKNPDGGIKLKCTGKEKCLEGQERQNAEKLMDDFIKQEWVLNKKSECFCKCIKKSKPVADIVDYRNYLFGKSIEINDETIDDIDNKAGYHVQKMIESYNNYKNAGDFYIVKSMSAGCEVVHFFAGFGVMRVEYYIKSKKPLRLELKFLENNEDKCLWRFVHKDIANN